MRMWMLNPELLCKKHLLGAHGELHKHRTQFCEAAQNGWSHGTSGANRT